MCPMLNINYFSISVSCILLGEIILFRFSETPQVTFIKHVQSVIHDRNNHMLKSKREEATRWYEIFTRLYINLLYKIIEVKQSLYFSACVVIYRTS